MSKGFFKKKWPFLFSFVNNVRSEPTLSDKHHISYYLETESLVCADLYPYVDRLYKVYIAVSIHVLFYFPFAPSVSSLPRYFKV